MITAFISYRFYCMDFMYKILYYSKQANEQMNIKNIFYKRDHSNCSNFQIVEHDRTARHFPEYPALSMSSNWLSKHYDILFGVHSSEIS